MSLLVPKPNRWLWSFDSRTDRPSTTDGTSTTPGNNSKGSYSAAIVSSANMAADAWWIEIYVSSGAASAAARDTLVDIGMDPAGGTSYSVLIPDLLAPSSAPYATFGGIQYSFPLHIPAGAQLAARTSVNGGAGNPRVAIAVYGQPTNPDMRWKGTAVEALGIVAASSRGTTVTSGTTSEGAWTSLGTASFDSWYVDVGFGIQNTAMSALGHHMDLSHGASGGDVIDLVDSLASTTAAEQVTKYASSQSFCEIPAGATVYGRMQCSGTPVSGLSMAAYLVS